MNWAMSLLLTAFLFASFNDMSVVGQDWLSDLLSNVGKINEKVQNDVHNINERVQNDVRRINEQVHRDVSNANENVRTANERVQNNVNQIQENLSSDLKRINQHVSEQVSSANQQVAEAIKRGETGPSSSLIVNGNAASSRSFKSGMDANGKPYQIESEDLFVGKTLIHTDRVYNYTSKILEEHRYTLDRSDPNAKPVYSDVIRTPFNV